ncbi:MAG: hypothetical protein AAFR61_13465 [Bacteroidota bacterium]
MYRHLLIVFYILASTVFAWGQAQFVPGFFIDESGKKMSCLILDEDWKDNPVSFQYRMTGQGESQERGLENTQAFGIEGGFTYMRAEVQIDRSTSQLQELLTNPYPVFEPATLFLKQIVSGPIHLYQYAESNLTRYFTQVGEGSIEQLVYKKYRTPRGEVATNHGFRDQLAELFTQEGGVAPKTSYLSYTASAISKFFQQQFEAQNQSYQVFRNPRRKAALALRIKAGGDVQNSIIRTDFGNQDGTLLSNSLTPQAGLELSYTLPFRNNAWEIFAGISYHRYFGQANFIINPIFNNDQDVSVDYQGLEFELGPRFLFYQKNDRVIYVQGTLYPNYIVLGDSKVDYEIYSDFQLSPISSIGLGLGARWGAFSMEVRSMIPRDLTRLILAQNTNLRRISLSLGFQLL